MRATAGAAGPLAPLLVVAGGKGGVGTTTVAANLAITLARQGRRTVFADADLDHGGHALLSGIQHRGSVVDVLAGRQSVHEVLERGPCGIQVLSGAWAADELTSYSTTAQERLIGELKHLAPHADVVVVDVGSGRNPFTQRLWRAADAVLVVTTTEPAAVMNAYAATKSLAGTGDVAERDTDTVPAIYSMINRTSDAATADDVQARIATACRRFLALEIGAAGVVPECPGEPDVAGVIIFSDRTEASRVLDRACEMIWTRMSAAKVDGLRPARRA
jgi:flagellar biosynthesis protein FlhG